MIILGLDLATSCGWAVLDGDSRAASGVWDLSGSRFEGGGMRYLRFRSLLAEVVRTAGVEAVAFEEVRAHASKRKPGARGPRRQNVTEAQVYGSFLGTLTAWCENRSLPYRGIPVATIKRTATGKGNASKELVVARALARWPGLALEGDDEADALWVAEVLRLELLPASDAATELLDRT